MRGIKSYVIRSGRISNLQKKSYQRLYSTYCINFQQRYVDFRSHYPDYSTFILEIGFGMGLATAQIAADNIDTMFLCTEVFTAGVGKLLGEIERRELRNISIIQHDAYEVVVSMIPDSSLDGIHIFFPDPWPKKRHRKRRLIQQPFLSLLISKLKLGGYLYFVTDWYDYAESVVSLIDEEPTIHNPFKRTAPPTDWRPETRFEKKAKDQQRSIFEVRCIKV